MIIMKRSLCIQTPETVSRSAISLISGDFDEVLSKARQWGADGIELMPVEPTQVDAPALLASLKAHSLQVAGVGTALLNLVAGLTLLNSDAGKAQQARMVFQQTIDFAAAVGAPLVTVGSFRGRFSSVGAGGRQQLSGLLRETAEYAVSRHVRLALEPINHYQSDAITSVAEGLAFLEEVNHPAVGLVIDTCHMVTDESSWSEPFHQAMESGKLFHVHIADSNRLPPGRGLVNFPAVMAGLHQIGYDQYLSLETLARPDPDTAAREGLDALHKLLLEVS
jgi:sugar phosphate isomerase/epimerase